MENIGIILCLLAILTSSVYGVKKLFFTAFNRVNFEPIGLQKQESKSWIKSYIHSVKTKLTLAGIESQKSLYFIQLQLTLLFSGVLAAFFYTILFKFNVLIISCCPLLFFFGPPGVLNHKIRKRQISITQAMPYYLDSLILTLEAGLDLISSMEEITSPKSKHPLDEEMMITLNSIKIGTPRYLAFQQLSWRTNVECVAVWAAAIKQSEELGSSLGTILRTQAQHLRYQLMQQAEIQAQTASVKLLLPLIALVFPVVFLLLFAPIFLSMGSIY